MKSVKLFICILAAIFASACTKQDTAGNNNPLQDPTPEHKDDKEISILAIGNSFSVDAMEYLYGILQQAGYEKITLGNLYIGGCSLEKHATNFSANSASYTYYKNTTGEWTKTASYKPLDALADEQWEYITMQQSSGNSGIESSYEPHLTTLMTTVRNNCPDSEFAWHMTWAYQGNSTHNDFPKYGNSQMTMYNAIVAAVNSVILPKSDFKKVIPNGTAVQNLRTSFIGDNITRDGYHMSYDKGRYVTALTFAKALTGCNLSEVTYTPAGQSFSEKEIEAIKEAADNAVKNPYKVTESTYLPDKNFDPATATLEEIISQNGYNPADYQKLEIAYTPHAYYNSTNSTYKSTLYTKENSTQTNLTQFVATPIYEKKDLPEGTLIVLKGGYQYRPEGWTALDAVNSSSTRPGNVTTNLVAVDASWWGKWNYRGFNLAKSGRPDLDEQGIKDVCESFGIYLKK